ncbi:MAG: Hsp20/alpha crystallin family protein [Methanotrichaceae archaeon]|nr:Hsp20/alpha crystallin family protein [Methanotrichaceae archaeon]
MTGLTAADELKKLQKKMNRLMDDLGLTNLESKYLEEMEHMQKRMGDLMEVAEKGEDVSRKMRPLADVQETDGEIIVTMDLPGIDKQNVDITISDEELSVVAERKTETETAEERYHKRERTYKKFERTVSLPTGVKMDEAKARLADGVLQITIPKEVVTSRKRISID